MRGLKPFKCHGYGLQVSTSVCVCVCMYMHFFNGTTIKQVAEFLLSCFSMKSSLVFFFFTVALSFAVKWWIKARPVKWNVNLIDSKFDASISKNYKLIILKFKIMLKIWSFHTRIFVVAEYQHRYCFLSLFNNDEIFCMSLLNYKYFNIWIFFCLLLKMCAYKGIAL